MLKLDQGQMNERKDATNDHDASIDGADSLLPNFLHCFILRDNSGPVVLIAYRD